MNLARHSITATNPVHIYDARFDADCNIFTVSTPAGFAVYRTRPLKLLRKRGRSPSLLLAHSAGYVDNIQSEITGGTLAAVVPLHMSSLLFLIGGGRSPRYPPNKVILWDEAVGGEVAELEFRERVRGLACRRGWLAVSLRRRVVVFQIQEFVTRYGEYDTCDNPRGGCILARRPYGIIHRSSRLACNGDRCIHHTACYTRSPNGTCAADSSPALLPAHAKWSTIILTPSEAATATYKAPGLYYCCAHDCPYGLITAPLWAHIGNDIVTRNLGPNLGFFYRKACPRI